MYYGTRESGRYFLRPIDPDRHGERFEITKERFYERWRAWAMATGENAEAQIAEAQSHMRDFDVF